MCHCVISGSIVASFDAASSSDSALDAMLDALATEVKDEKSITFEGKDYPYEKNSMLVDNKSYGTVEKAVSDCFVMSSAMYDDNNWLYKSSVKIHFAILSLHSPMYPG